MTLKKYPSRSAHKLLCSLSFFRKTQPIDVSERLCLDLGCAQGGFVKVLLEQGAKRVYAVDVGYGVLDYSLRQDPRVMVRERHNLRYLNSDWFLPEDLEELKRKDLFCSCDASFISANTVLTSLRNLRDANHISVEALLLVKPQFEASKKTNKGVIQDINLQKELVAKVMEKARLSGFRVIGSTPVEPKGTRGNQEYMLYIQ